MKSKKIYASPEIDIISFSFENILNDTDDPGSDDPGYIRRSNPESSATGGANGSWG